MAGKVFKRIIEAYLKKFAEPKIKEVTGKEVELSLWGVNRYVAGSWQLGNIFVDTNITSGRIGSEIEKIIIIYVNQALRFLGEDKNKYKVHIDKRSLNPLDESLPFQETIKENERVRVFLENIDDSELKWHQDNEDRLVTPLHETDWMVQLDDQLPIELKVGENILIPEGVWHRVIKGTKDLKVKVTFI